MEPWMDAARPVNSLRQLCLSTICDHINHSAPLIESVLMTDLNAEDLLHVLTVAKISPEYVDPLQLLIQRGAATLLLDQSLRERLVTLCAQQSRTEQATRNRLSTIASLRHTPNSLRQCELVLVARFCCDMDWHLEGRELSKFIQQHFQSGTSFKDGCMVLEALQQQLSSLMIYGDIREAYPVVKELETKLWALKGGDISVATARITVAEFALLIEKWQRVVCELTVAVHVLASFSSPPLDIVCRLASVICRLRLLLHPGDAQVGELTARCSRTLQEVCGEHNALALDTLKLVAECCADAGLTAAASDILMRCLSLCDVYLGPNSERSNQALLHLALSRRGPTSAFSQGDLEFRLEELLVSKMTFVPIHSMVFIDGMLASAQAAEDRALNSSGLEEEVFWAVAMEKLHRASGTCELLLGPKSVRLATIFTEKGRILFSLSLSRQVNRHPGEPSAPDDLSTSRQAEMWLKRASQMLIDCGVPPLHRSRLLVKVTLGCLYTYSPLSYLQEAETILSNAVLACFSAGRARCLDLLRHSLRALVTIYGLRGEMARADACDQQLLRLDEHQQRQLSHRIPLGATIASILPPQLPPRRLLNFARSLLAKLEIPVVATQSLDLDPPMHTQPAANNPTAGAAESTAQPINLSMAAAQTVNTVTAVDAQPSNSSISSVVQPAVAVMHTEHLSSPPGAAQAAHINTPAATVQPINIGSAAAAAQPADLNRAAAASQPVFSSAAAASEPAGMETDADTSRRTD